jgi:phage gp29-like protein
MKKTATTPARKKPALNATRPPAESNTRALNKAAIWTPDKARMERRSRWNPLKGLTLDRYAQHSAAFQSGYLAAASLMWQEMARKDGTTQSVQTKRTAAVALRPYFTRLDSSIDQDPVTVKAAKDQRAALRYFWRNLTVTNTYDRNQRGGFQRFVELAMNAQSHYYGAFHIIWKPSAKGLTAELEFVPLEFFENLTGELRFLGSTITGGDGEPLDSNEWITLAGRGCMDPAGLLYIPKHLGMNDLLTYSNRYGLPYPVISTSASPDSPEWKAATEALTYITNEGGAVVGGTTKVDLLEAKGTGGTPMEALINYADKAITVIFRGSDLGTHSSQHSSGASLQKTEGEFMCAMDAAWISEVMQRLETQVLAWMDGEGTDRLAYSGIRQPNLADTDSEVRIDQFLAMYGGKLGRRETLERYQREEPEPGEDILEMVAPGMNTAKATKPGEQKRQNAADLTAQHDQKAMATNEAPTPALISDARAAVQDDLAAVIDALKHALAAEDDAELTKRLAALDQEALTTAVLKNGALSQVIIGALGDAFTGQLDIPGIAEAVIEQRISEA